MESGEFVQRWHASFGQETQPPESCSNPGERLTAQDVGTELRACETRVDGLSTQLKRELRVLDWLRRLVAELERQAAASGEEDTRRHIRPSSPAERKEEEAEEAEGEEGKCDQSPASHPRARERQAAAGHEESSSSCQRAVTSVSTASSPPLPRPDAAYTISVEVKVQSDRRPTPEEHPRPTTEATKDDTRDTQERERRATSELLARPTRQEQTNEADKSVARAVRKRLIEQGKWWSSNLLTLEVPPQARTPPTHRPRPVSDPPHRRSKSAGHQRSVPSVKVHKVIESFEKLVKEEETVPQVNSLPATPRKEVSHPRRHTSVEAVNEQGTSSPIVERAKVEEIQTVQKGSERPINLPVRRTVSAQQDPAPLIRNHSLPYSTRSLNRRHWRLRSANLEEEGSQSSTLSRKEKRRSNGWKVVEVGSTGLKRPFSKTPSPSPSALSSRTVSEESVPESTETERAPPGKKSSIRQHNSHGDLEPGVATSKQNKGSEVDMFKAAKEKLSRVTSSPPLRRRPSRGSRGREGSGAHRSSNGQVETTSASGSAGAGGGGVVQEVMVEKRVERSESLLSEIMSHRFSNGMDGSQLLESGDHSLVSSQEGGGGGGGEGDSAKVPSLPENQPKVILRRRSERDNDPLPEAKRRSSYLEDDDCSTPKEDFSLSMSSPDDSITQGLTNSMIEAATNKRAQVQRLASDSTLRQESLEATLTPGNMRGSSPTGAGNVNFRMSYMTAVHDSPQLVPTGTGGVVAGGGGGGGGSTNQVDFMPLIDEEGTTNSRLALVSSEPNLLDIDQVRGILEDSMELDEATISAVTLNNDMFSSRSGSVTSLPETLDDSQSTSTASLTESFLSPTHTPAGGGAVVNLRQTGSGSGGRYRNRRRYGNSELDDQTGGLVQLLTSRTPNTTLSSTSESSNVGSLSPMVEEGVREDQDTSPTATSLFPPPLPHGAHLKDMETQSPGPTRSSRVYPVRRSTVVVQGEKLVIRKLVVAGIVSAEKSYLDCLNVMKEFYRKPLLARTTTSQVILSERDINTVFYRTDDLAAVHAALHDKLEPQLRDWSVNTCVGDFFVELCKNLKLYKDYVEFYKQSLQCLERLKSENAAFKTFLEDVRATVMAHYKDVPRVNELLRRPIERLQSYSLILNDLCQHTPEDHKDYNVLRQSLHAMSAFIASTHDPQSFSQLSGGYNRELVKEGLMVELSEGIRKVRRVFLFHDVVVSSKQKPTRAGMKFEPKWFLPLAELSFHPPEETPEAHRPVPATSDMDLSVMRNRIAELKAQIGKENTRDRSGSQPEREGSFRKGRGGGIRGIYTMKTNRAVERTKKKLQEQQVSYWMAVPSLPLRLYADNGKQQYMFLLHSEQERESWISSIKKLQPKAVHQVSFNPLELQDLLNHQTISELRKIEEVTLPVLEDEYLSGMLRIRIMSATDIKAKTAGGIYCAVELDEYGKFERKAKTLPVPNDPTTLGATWDQDFELEVTGAHIIKVNICSKQLLKEETYAHGKIRLPIHELRSNKRHKTDITLYPQGSLQIIIEYSSSASRDRKPALMSSGVFGVPIEVVSKRERHDIPLIVETCVEEVERRGMSEVGIYRVAGVLRDVKELREAFDTDYLKAQVIAFEADIHAVAGLLKKYFRELPDPLFTNDLYPSFVDGMGLSDPEAREQTLVTLLYSLPPVNFKTAIFLFKHLRRIAANSSLNKMNLNNLATLFGPNLLRPAPSGSQEEFLLNMAAVDVATPVNVLMFFLSCPEELLDEAQAPTSPSSTASTGRGRRRDSRKKLTWIEEEDGGKVRTSRRSSGRTSQT